MLGKCGRAISVLVSYMNKTPEVQQFLSGWESKLLFDLDGEDPFSIRSDSGTVTFQAKAIDNPDAILICDADLFYSIITGKVSQDDAFSLGLVDIHGSIVDVVKFRHAAELTQKKHGILFSALRAISKLT